MEKCRQWVKKNAYWGISILLFVVIAGIFAGVRHAGEKEYRVVCLGDSIMGDVRDNTAVSGYIEVTTGMSVYNGGFGGTKASCVDNGNRAAVDDNVFSLVELTEAIVYQDFSVQNAGVNRYNGMEYFAEGIKGLNRVDWSEVEILIIEHGVNDYLSGAPLDNPENAYDVTTYGGALRYTLRLLQDKRPDLRIILCTPTYCWFYAEQVSCQEKNLGGGYLEDYVNLELEIAKEFGVEIIDNFHESGIGGAFENWSDYTEDGLHLNDAGRKLIAGRISAVIMQGTE